MERLPDERLAESYDLEGVIQASEATVVVRGRAKATGDPVVVKVLRLSGTGVGEVHRTRFLRAASALINTTPAGAPPLRDAAWGPEFAVLVFVPVPGTRLTQLSGLNPSQAAHILARAAASVASLHQAGVAHLNLSPDNLLVASLERVYLTGLGWGFLRMPASGAPFAAPELRKALDLAEPQRCDVFSLAQVTAELFDAQLVYQEEEARVTLPPAVRDQLRLWEELEACLGRCLHLDPFERPGSVTELGEALGAAVVPGAVEEEGTVRLLEEEQAGAPPEPPGAEARTVVLSSGATAAAGSAQGEETDRGEAGKPPEKPLPSVSSGERVTVVPPPAEVPPAPEPPAPKPATPPPAVRAQLRQVRKKPRHWALVGGGLAALTALVALGLWFVGEKGPAPRPAPPPPPTAVKATPPPTAVPAVSAGAAFLARGEALVASGQWEELRALLSGVAEETLTDAEKARLGDLRSHLAAHDREQALAALRRSLKNGDLPAMRRALRDFDAAKKGEEGLAPEDRHLLAQARSIAQALARIGQEEKAQRWEQVFLEVQNLERLIPGTREAAAAQENAAQALERQAMVAEGQGDLLHALNLLQTLQRYLPARPGLGEKIATLQEAQARKEKLRRVLDRAAQLGNEGKPEQGLALLAEVPPSAGSAAEIAALKEKLAQQLATLDAGTPTVSPPAPNHKWEYPKGQVARVEVKASDDHGVARVTMFFRKKGEKSFRSVPMSRTSAGTYVAEIVPATHGNEDLEFYVLGEDHSGHQGRLGSPERPLELRRKRGLFGL